MSTPFRLLLPPQLHAQILAHAQAERPNECCGFLAGTIGTDGIARVERCYPMVNALASPIAYEWEPRGQIKAMRDMEPLTMLAIYHSHPTSAPVPSRTDRQRYAEARPLLGEVMHFIIGLAGDEPEVRAWWLLEDSQREAEWELV